MKLIDFFRNLLSSKFLIEVKEKAPQMSNNESLITRENYILQYEEISKKINKDLVESPEDLSQIIDVANSLVNHVVKPSIFAKDLILMKSMTEKATQLASSFQVGNYTPTLGRIILAIRDRFQMKTGNKIDWELFGDWSLRKSKVAPKISKSLIGIENYIPPSRKKRQYNQQQQRDILPETKEIGLKTQTQRFKALSEKATALYNKLINKEKMPLTELLGNSDEQNLQSENNINLNGFTDVVQKAFQLSHLMSNGKVGLMENNGEVFVEKVKNEENEKDAGRHQCILHLNYQDYTQMFQ